MIIVRDPQQCYYDAIIIMHHYVRRHVIIIEPERRESEGITHKTAGKEREKRRKGLLLISLALHRFIIVVHNINDVFHTTQYTE